MATDKTQGLPHVAAASAAEIAAAAIAPFVQKRLASLTRSRDAVRNSIRMMGTHVLGHSACHGVNNEELRVKLLVYPAPIPFEHNTFPINSG